MKAAWHRGAFDGMFGEEHRRKLLEGTKARWAQGNYNGIFTKECRRRISEGLRAAHAQGAWSSEESRHKRSKSIKAYWAQEGLNGSFTREHRRKLSEGRRAAWARGAYDGVFTSPSKPERAVAEVLDNLGIDYEMQYRIPGDSRPFDFFIPPRMLIEVDGSYWHDDTKHPGVAARDMAKSTLAEKCGYHLVRMTDLEIVEYGVMVIIEDVLDRIVIEHSIGYLSPLA